MQPAKKYSICFLKIPQLTDEGIYNSQGTVFMRNQNSQAALISDPQDIQYDSIRKEIVIFHRGKRTVLTGPYHAKEEGIEAGREYLRSQGWQG
jgi:hypothetical protein